MSDWWQLSLSCSREQSDHCESLLLEAGALSLQLADAAGESIYEPAPGETPLWSKLKITALFDHAIHPETVFNQLASNLETELLASIETHELANQVWERICLERFKPMRFGQRLWICPSWQQPPDPKACNVILDPGIAFGTGTHPTTAQCLQMLDRNPPEQLDVIDYGCGSGILSVAALKLGAKKVIATDIDPQALAATEANAQLNHIDKNRLITCLPDQFPEMQVDYLLANILSSVLVELQPQLTRLLKPSARIVLSGIMQQQQQQVIEAFQDFFDLEAVKLMQGWCCITGTRIH